MNFQKNIQFQDILKIFQKFAEFEAEGELKEINCTIVDFVYEHL